ncbi:ABC transporter ATP-binding protein [uncultured Celeribacter sp.]|uniref:ABC transporter ATP-binding protein n=1 Tax=uncultured Celeribacter sp. TaxID=1303376 RepID=UPI002AA7A6BD|nr:ABC transporter ATP-binding protein [uncultured Celeribacter sp.]
MIYLKGVAKQFSNAAASKTVLHETDFLFPAKKRVGLLGRNGAGKSTLLKIIAGTQDPDKGQVIREGAVSWPIGFAGSFHPHLTGAQNARFLARVYGMDTDAFSEFVEDFVELGNYYRMPVHSYSSGMRARLAFGVSMGVPFDIYLVDEITSVGDERFRAKCDAVFQTKLKGQSAIIVTHSLAFIRRNCDHVAILEKGQLTFYDDVEQGVAQHQANMKSG